MIGFRQEEALRVRDRGAEFLQQDRPILVAHRTDYRLVGLQGGQHVAMIPAFDERE